MARHWTVRALPMLAAVVAVLLLILILGAYLALRGSLPQLEGSLRNGAISAPVIIKRDALGVPRIEGHNRRDVSFALGYLHAQERFFQMDLYRRAAAGELAELFGANVTDLDRERRLFRPRQVARAAVQKLSAEHLDLLYAYRDGVNAGLEALGVRPFEYLLLLKQPEPWTIEDSILAGMVLYFDLQDDLAQHDVSRLVLGKVAPESVCRFLTQYGGPWQAALDGSVMPTVPIPPAEDWAFAFQEGDTEKISEEPAPKGGYGSNAWAVSGAHTHDGRAILANDMHLELRLPNIWYRAQLVVAEEGLEVIGTTLPGLPLVVTGSNGAIAWGFTNSYIDTANLVRLEEPEEGMYLTADGPRAYQLYDFPIEVRFGDDQWMSIEETVWGPVVEVAGERFAIAWAGASFPLSLDLMGLERARSLEEGLDAAHKSDAPAQNILIASSDGRIGWTLAGDIPAFAANEGFEPPLSSSLPAQPLEKLRPEAYPQVIDPEDGILWSANNRFAGGEVLEQVGDGGYSEDARAWQIREALASRQVWAEHDHLALQLDARAPYLERWQELLMETLRASEDPELHELIPFVENWGGEAQPGSAAYRYVNLFSESVVTRLALRLLRPVYTQYPQINLWRLRLDQPMFQIASQKPAYLADPDLGSIEEELELIARGAMEILTQKGERPITEAVWGERNFLDIDHPLTLMAPFLSRWLNLEERPLPGDMHTPRASRPGFGASERMVVSPGHEEDGIYHMPGGQSGHPLSPNYSDTTDAWATGEALPLLPGSPVYTLRMLPLHDED